MRRIVNPQQNRLFDSFNPVLTAQTQRLLLDDWPGVFRHVILELMPVEQLGSHLHATMGRPSKELYSMAGLLLLMELMDWTKQEAMYEYCFNMAVHYALNLEPVAQDLSVRTLERYIVRFEEEELASKVMHDVSVHLIKLLDIKIDQQRLDSTHVFSNMASFGRTRLMGVAIKRFLTQVNKHDPAGYGSLDEQLRRRYAPSVHQLFGDTGKDSKSRNLLRQQVAEDMYALIKHFADDPKHSGRNTFKTMERIFYYSMSSAKFTRRSWKLRTNLAATSYRIHRTVMAIRGLATRPRSPRPAIRKMRCSWLPVLYLKPLQSQIRMPHLKYWKA